MVPVSPLERFQVVVYLAAIALGLAIGVAAPGAAAGFDAAVYPTIGILLFVTFLLVPLRRVRDAVRDARFVSATLVANFALVPVVVGLLLLLVPDEVAGIDGGLVRLGIVLVLVVPCTDWFLTFTHLARGDAARAVAVTPLLLIVQLLLLPVYVALFTSGEVRASLNGGELALTFVSLILIPLVLAAITQGVATRSARLASAVDHASHLPVPLLALVLLFIAASQVGTVLDAVPLLPLLVGLFALFLVGAVGVGIAVSRVARLGAGAARTLVFSVATRNSFVVLPIALAIPDGGGVVAVVVVTQSLVELIGIALLVRLVPRLVPDAPATPPPTTPL